MASSRSHPRGSLPRACLLLALALGAARAGEAPVIAWTALDEPGAGAPIAAVAVSPHDHLRVLVAGAAGAWASLDRGERWQASGGADGGGAGSPCGAITWHPREPLVAWAGSRSGPCVSGDGGVTWRLCAGAPAPIQEVLVDPGDGRRLLAFAGARPPLAPGDAAALGTVWESRDGGAAWAPLGTVLAGGDVLDAAVAAAAPLAVYAVVRGAGVHASEDGGRSWTPRNAGLPHAEATAVALHPTLAGTLWVALASRARADGGIDPGGVHRSRDGGRTWEACGRGLAQLAGERLEDASRYLAVAVSDSDPRLLLTADSAREAGVVYLSDDGGASWRDLARRGDVDCADPAGLDLGAIAFDPADQEIAFVGGRHHLLRTMNGGTTWQDATSHVPDEDPGLWRGRGLSGLRGGEVVFNPRRGRQSLLIGDDGACWHSRDGLWSWSRPGEGVEGVNDAAFAGEGGATIHLALGRPGFGGIATSRDGGVTWRVRHGDAHGLPVLGAVGRPARAVQALADQPDVAWVVVGDRVLRTTDGGERWDEVHAAPGLGRFSHAGDGSLPLVLPAAQGVLRSVDGLRFALMPGSPASANAVFQDPRPPRTLYATAWGAAHGGLWRWDGAQWNRLRPDPAIVDGAVDPADGRRLVVCTRACAGGGVAMPATGIWWSEDAGATWSAQNAGLPALGGGCVRFIPGRPGRLVLGGDRGFMAGALRVD